MAIIKEPMQCTMRLKYQKGVDGAGKPVYETRSFSKVKVTAGDAELYSAAQALNSLQTKVLMAVVRVDDSELVEE